MAVKSSQLVSVVYEGVLQLGKDPNSTSSKDWKTYLFVLRRDPDSKKSALYYYKDLSKRWQKQTSKGSIELWPYIQLSLAHNCSYKFPLKITDVKGNEYLLAASSFDDMNKWCNNLQSQCYLVPSNRGDYCEFSVQAIKSVSTSLLGISGDCILALTPQQQLVCALRSTRQLVGVWPFGSLRKYWGGKERFGFQSGRRSPRGEGEFTFITKQGEEIYRRLERAIQLTAVVSKSRVEDSLPPDPTRAETPVPFSDSDEELPQVSEKPPPPVPDKPPELLKRLSMGGLPPPHPSPTRQPIVPGSVVTDEVSETSPAYFTNQSAKYIHQKVTHTSSSKIASQHPAVKPPLESSQSVPTIARPLPLSDDTYSHATHEIPHSLVGKRSSLKTPPVPADVDKDKIYHGLVREESTRSPSKTPIHTAEPLPEGDITYDIAYPLDPSAPQQSRVPFIPGGEYSSMEETGQQKERKVSVEARRRLLSDETSFGAKLRGRVESKGQGLAAPQDEGARDRSDTLTANPLYGSKDSVLVNYVGGDVGYNQGGYHDQGRYGEDVDHDPFSDSMVANPVYGEHMPVAAAGYSRNVNLYPDDRPVSPLENALISNPLYGKHRSTNPLHQGTSNFDEETLHQSMDGSEGSRESDQAKQSPDAVTTLPEEQAESTDNEVFKGTDSSQNAKCHSPGQYSSKKKEDIGTSKEDEGAITSNENPDTHLADSESESGVPSIIVKQGQPDEESEDVSTTTASHSSNGGTPVHTSNGDSPETTPPSRLSQRDAAAAPTSSMKGGTPDHAGHTLVKGRSPCGSDNGASPIRRDGRGYSKVDKTRKAEGEEKEGESTDTSPPPPIPPRKYSNGCDS